MQQYGYQPYQDPYAPVQAEQFPIVWHFYFYRAPASGMTMSSNRPWKLIEIRFDTNLEVLDR